MKHAFGDGLDDLVDLARDLGQFLLGFGFALCRFSRQPIVLLPVGGNELGDQIRMQQLVLETGQDARFQFARRMVRRLPPAKSLAMM